MNQKTLKEVSLLPIELMVEKKKKKTQGHALQLILSAQYKLHWSTLIWGNSETPTCWRKGGEWPFLWVQQLRWWTQEVERFEVTWITHIHTSTSPFITSTHLTVKHQITVSCYIYHTFPYRFSSALQFNWGIQKGDSSDLASHFQKVEELKSHIKKNK